MINEESDLENYSPYCEECTACGESGCCSVYMCTMGDKCDYKQTYLRELKEAYSLMEEFYKHIYEKLPEDLKAEFDKLEETNWEYWYGKDRTDS
jgi:hypothetical protein